MDYVRTKIGRAVLYYNGAEGYATKSHDFTAWRRNPSISLLLYYITTSAVTRYDLRPGGCCRVAAGRDVITPLRLRSATPEVDSRGSGDGGAASRGRRGAAAGASAAEHVRVLEPKPTRARRRRPRLAASAAAGPRPSTESRARGAPVVHGRGVAEVLRWWSAEGRAAGRRRV